jgi:Tfp pilus assembly protein PilF
VREDTTILMARLLADDAVLQRREGRATADPTDPKSTLSVTLALLQAGDYAAAQTLLHWALDFDPKDSRLLRRMTDITLLQGDRDAARRWAERAIASDPADAENHDNLAKLFMWVGAFAEAETAEERAVALAPRNAEMSRRLAEIRKHLGGPATVWRAGQPVAIASQAASMPAASSSAISGASSVA